MQLQFIKYQRRQGSEPQGLAKFERVVPSFGPLGDRQQGAVGTAELEAGQPSGYHGQLWASYGQNFQLLPRNQRSTVWYCFSRSCQHTVRSDRICLRDVLASGCQSVTCAGMSVIIPEPWQIGHGEGRSRQRAVGPGCPVCPHRWPTQRGPSAEVG